jgi:hypothetical protein
MSFCFVTACAVYAYYLLSHAQCTLTIGTRLRSTVYANKANNTLILPFQLNQVNTLEKSKKSKKLFGHIQMNLKGIWNNFVGAIIQSQKALSAYKMAPSEKRIIFNFMLKVAYLQRLYGVKNNENRSDGKSHARAPLKRDLSIDTTFNPPPFSSVNTFNDL